MQTWQNSTEIQDQKSYNSKRACYLAFVHLVPGYQSIPEDTSQQKPTSSECPETQPRLGNSWKKLQQNNSIPL